MSNTLKLGSDDGNSSSLTVIKEHLENSILNLRPVEINFLERSIFLYPHRIIYIDSKLCLIAEDSVDKSLSYFDLSKINKVTLDLDSEYSSHHSAMEIDDFIASMRAITGNEVRLVLKIFSCDNIDLTPINNFIGNPYMVTNSKGDTIWGGSIEPCKSIFEWILQMGDNIEILDPTSFKRDFLKFCEIELEKGIKVA